MDETKAVGLRNQVQQVTDAQARHIIAILIEQGFLQQDNLSGELWLGPKTHLELKQHLQSLRDAKSNTIGFCNVCHDLCIRGLTCQTQACKGTRVHIHCADNTNRKCSDCQKELNENGDESEDEEVDEDVEMDDSVEPSQD
jgi:hypothetical protein